MLRSFAHLGVRHAAGRDDDDVGPQLHDGVLVREHVEAHVCTVLAHLLQAPVDDADEVPATFGPGRDRDLAAVAIGGLQQRDVVSAHCADSGGLEPCWAGSDDDDAPRALRETQGPDPLRQRLLPPRRGIVDAVRRTGHVDRIEAGIRSHAGADVVLFAGRHLLYEVRISDLRTGHADEVDAPIVHRVTGGGDIGDAGGVEDRDGHRNSHRAAEFEEGSRGGAHAGDRLREGTVASRCARR